MANRACSSRAILAGAKVVQFCALGFHPVQPDPNPRVSPVGDFSPPRRSSHVEALFLYTHAIINTAVPPGVTRFMAGLRPSSLQGGQTAIRSSRTVALSPISCIVCRMSSCGLIRPESARPGSADGCEAEDFFVKLTRGSERSILAGEENSCHHFYHLFSFNWGCSP
jgi:hypothetical protein